MSAKDALLSAKNDAEIIKKIAKWHIFNTQPFLMLCKPYK
jgi:hypothetical protein